MGIRPSAIDPFGCGCTECLIGEYVPEERATNSDWFHVLTGDIRNNTHMTDDEFYDKALVAVRSSR